MIDEETSGVWLAEFPFDENEGAKGNIVLLVDLAISEEKIAGFDPSEFSGHSLRAGFVTSAAERGKTTERIMDHTGHRSVAMVQVYTRRHDAFADHAADGLL